jgi:PIN domain nuclease of toxin-antitoxin system
LWWRDDSPRLPARIGEEIHDPDNVILVSTISLWEIAVKRAFGKLQFSEDFERVIAEEVFDLLPVTYAHLRRLADLPLLHRDPFDRLLIAQALAERVPVATADRNFAHYGVETVT